MRRLLLIALTFLVGAAAGVAASLITWKPYGEGSLTHAIVRKCGVRERPQGNARCEILVANALDAWFIDFYPGDYPTDPLSALERISARADTSTARDERRP